MTYQRRNFLKSFSAAAAGAIISPNLGLSEEIKGYEEIIGELDHQKFDNSEKYWKKVSKQFEFAEGLKYFNNASLGACPQPIRKATNGFRNILDNFPSKYMWGGWRAEIEKTRTQVANLFSVSNEEIALIHNTTEGMNLIARSFDLQEGDEIILADHEHTSGAVCWEVFQETKGDRKSDV